MSKLKVEISRELHDQDWDQFVQSVADGQYNQTSLWGEVKETQGWSPVRIKLIQENNIVAGAQILTRSLPVIGSFGYITKGPLRATDDPFLAKGILQSVIEFCKTEKILYLMVQPPDQENGFVRYLEEATFMKSSQGEIERDATILIDLSPDEQIIRTGIRPAKRRYLDYAEKHGVVYREGTKKDLKTFFDLNELTGKRNNFETLSYETFEKLWDVFAPHGHIKLYMGEFKGKTMTSLLAIIFKDTIYNFRIAWSGDFREKHPNEGMLWHVIKSAKSLGYRYFDFSGVDIEAANSIKNNQPIPEYLYNSYTGFKLHFSKDIKFYSETYEIILNPLIYKIYNGINAMPFLKNSIMKIYELIRKR